MDRTWKRLSLMTLVVIGLAVVWLLNAPSTDAQCGSSMSSCKSCHEVQAQDPINDKGEWHTAHAFGDFCEFCHAGNVQAQDEAAAHQGLVDPFSDVKAGCQSCHPDDYTDRAQKYATALGAEIGTGGGGGAPSSGGSDSAPPAQPPAASSAQASLAAPPTDPEAAVAAPSGGEVIDFNQVYVGSREAAGQSGMNKGDALLATLIVLLVVVFVGLVWHFENVSGRLAGWWQANMVMGPQAVALGAGDGSVPLSGSPAVGGPPAPTITDWSGVLTNRPELSEVLAELATVDPATLEATARLLHNRPLGPRVVKAVAKLDLNLLAAVSHLDAPEMELLMALRKEL